MPTQATPDLSAKTDQMKYPHRNADWTSLLIKLKEQIAPDQEVLILGWSGSALAADLKKDGYRIAIIDREELIYKAMEDRPELRGGYGLKATDLSTPHELIKHGKFAAILFISALETIPGKQVEQSIKEYTELLTPDGVIVVSQIRGMSDKSGFHPSGPYNNHKDPSAYTETLHSLRLDLVDCADITAKCEGEPCTISNAIFKKQ